MLSINDTPLFDSVSGGFCWPGLLTMGLGFCFAKADAGACTTSAGSVKKSDYCAFFTPNRKALGTFIFFFWASAALSGMFLF